MTALIKPFDETDLKQVGTVGGKNASLGEMIAHLSRKGIPVPNGFATTAYAFELFLTSNKLHTPLLELMKQLDKKGFSNLQETGAKARALIMAGVMPPALVEAIYNNYRELGNGLPVAVAVRSSATAEDLPQASFAGQHESFLNIEGEQQVAEAVKKCYASLYTNRAIKYREDNGFAHEKVYLSAGIQMMVRSDKGCSGVIFTLEPESGFRDIVHISGVWGLGENIVQGTVNPDEFLVFKPTLAMGKKAIIQKRKGDKALTMVYGNTDSEPVVNIATPRSRQEQYVLSDEDIYTLARWAVIIEAHYGKPMDIEWARDGVTQQMYIIQARPETVHSRVNTLQQKQYSLPQKGPLLAQGQAVGNAAVTGVARILQTPAEAALLQKGEILVTTVTSPDWDPILKNAAAIITDKGGRTSHASIVARELGVPAVVGCGNATAAIKNGEQITVACCEGKTGSIYQGKLAVQETLIDFSHLTKPETTEVMLITADPDQAFKLSFYPNDGVGLMRMEFIIAHSIQIHPMALVNYATLTGGPVKEEIDRLTSGYDNKEEYFIDKLSQGLATMAAAFYPKDVIVRMSDFKTNEYANLLGGKDYEPVEENPMLGFRGASRYYNDLYRDGFRLECAAVKRVRDEMGLDNVKVMIPFCRTVEEGRKVIAVMKKFGLEQGVNNLEVYVMAEIPGNVILAEQFAAVFDGFSIGSNDLTQLTLGIDRDSAVVSNLFNENDAAAKEMVMTVIERATRAGVRIGLCGQAPSDFPEYAAFLVQLGIDSISFNPDALLKGIENIIKAEKQPVTRL